MHEIWLATVLTIYSVTQILSNEKVLETRSFNFKIKTWRNPFNPVVTKISWRREKEVSLHFLELFEQTL